MNTVEGWKTESLGRVAQITMGQSPDSKFYSEEENGLPFLQGCAEFEGRFPKHSLYCSQTKKIADGGSILFSVRAPVGRINIADRDYIIGRGLAAISGKHIEQTYLEHYLTFVEVTFRNASQGSTFEAINSTELIGWPIKFPTSRPEQTKIAEILSSVDRVIEQTKALIAKQQCIKTGLMQDLLIRGIDDHGNLRSEATHRFKDTPLGRIPVEWDVTVFGDAGIWFSGGTPSKANSQFWGGSVPWISPKDMKQLELSSTIDMITEHAVATGIRLMPKGTVFIVIRGMILAHTFPVGYSIREAAFNQDVKAIAAIQCLDGRYLAYWLVSHSRELLKLATTATHGTKRFDMDDLYAVPIGVPQPDEQMSILHVLDEQQALIDRTEVQAQNLQALKTALMQDLLTGKKRVAALLKDMEAATL